MCSAPDPNTLTTTVTQAQQPAHVTRWCTEGLGVWYQAESSQAQRGGWGSRAGWKQDPSPPCTPESLFLTSPHHSQGSSLDKVVHLCGDGGAELRRRKTVTSA